MLDLQWGNLCDGWLNCMEDEKVFWEKYSLIWGD